jgi:hypothetical protein
LTWFGFFPSNLWRVQRINTCISSSAKLMHRFHPNKIKWELGCALETTKVVFELAKTEWSHHYIQLKKVKWWVALLHYDGFMIFKLGMLIFNLTQKKWLINSTTIVASLNLVLLLMNIYNCFLHVLETLMLSLLVDHKSMRMFMI